MREPSVATLDEEAARAAFRTAREEGLTACAIVLMHAWKYPAHEQRLVRLARMLDPVRRGGGITHHTADRIAHTAGRFAGDNVIMVGMCGIGGMVH